METRYDLGNLPISKSLVRPALHPATSVCDHPSQPYTWVFEEEVLEESLSQLWSFAERKYPDQTHEVFDDLLSRSIGELPYRSGDSTVSTPMRFLDLISSPGQEHFIIDNLIPAQRAGILQRDTKIPCLVCGKEYILGNMRMHVGRHILHDVCGQAHGERNQEVCQAIYYAQAAHLTVIDTARVGAMWLLRWR